jgi:hypothetical protein
MELLGLASTPQEIAGLLDLQRRRLGLTNLCLDDLSGVQQGYTGKLFAGVKRLGEMSLPALLGAVGCKIVVVADDDWLPAVTRRHVGSFSDRRCCYWVRPPILLPDRANVFCAVPGELPPLLTYTPPASDAS